MKPISLTLMVVLGSGAAFMESSAIGSEPPDSTPVAAKPEATAEPVAEKAKEFKPPPGFRTKKRGKFTLYCKREAPMGTRLKSEICLDEDQMRDYMLALSENKRDIDRIRAICSNPCACGQPGAC